MILEICANSYQSAINAQEAEAARIELCSELAVGGITPSFGLLKKVMNDLTIPVFVLIRPRGGNFTYSDAEFEQMKYDIELCKELGCSGIVSGVLNKNNTLDVIRTRKLVDLSYPLPFTFHRAFDWISNPRHAIRKLIEIKVSRVLSSGQRSSAEKGVELLKELKSIAENNLIILPGGGINVENVALFKLAGFKEIHASASSLHRVNKQPEVSMSTAKFFSETELVYADKEKIESILKEVKD